jgi:replicative DNA helicase
MTFAPPPDLAARATAAERALVGCILKAPERLDDAHHVSESDFRDSACLRVWQAVRSLANESKPLDLVSVFDRLAAAGPFPDPSGGAMPFLVALHGECTAPVLAEHYAGMVRDYALLRALSLAGQRITQLGDAPTGPAAEMIHQAEADVYALTDRAVSGNVIPLAEAIERALDRADERVMNGPGLQGVPTGLDALNAYLGGLRPGQLVVVAARPSIGKTALALAMLRNAAACGHACLLCSIEQSRDELADRLLVASAGIPGRDLLFATLSDRQLGELRAARPRLVSLPVWLDDCPAQSALRIAANARRLKRQHNLAVCFVDYLQLVQPEDRSVPRHEQVASISRRLKQAAREVRIPVVALAQLNREVESRTDKKPRMSDLRESGNIEADADVIILLHLTDADGDTLELNVAKNRNGQTGECSVRFDRSLMRFTEDVQ